MSGERVTKAQLRETMRRIRADLRWVEHYLAANDLDGVRYDANRVEAGGSVLREMAEKYIGHQADRGQS